MSHNTLSEKFDSPPILPEHFLEHFRSDSDLDDREFDQILPPLYRQHAPVQWTSIKVVKTIAEWLKPYENKCFIDIGSGVGKLCILLRFLTDLEIHGIEQRPHLVAIAQEIAKVNGLEGIVFTEGNLLDLKWGEFDIFYLYNPFQEHTVSNNNLQIDGKIEFDKKYFHIYTAKVFEELTKLKSGSILITFHGFGGSIPKSWKLKQSQFIDGGFLSMWVK